MSRAKDPKKEIRGRDKELNSYKETLRDASLQFEDKVLELSLLRRVSDIVGYILDPELFYQMFVDILLDETNAENCSIMIMDTETKILALKMARGRNDEGKFFNHPVDSEVTFFLGEEVAKKVALERKTILIDDVSIDKCFAKKETHFPIGSLLCTPLIFQEKVFGVINLSHIQPHAFSQSNKRTMDLLCALVSSIIGNAIDYIKVKDQEKFKSMFEGVRIPILLVDPKTNSIVGCNGYAEEWLGYSKKELIHTDHIFDIVPHEYREKVECILNEIVEKNSSEFNEVSFIRKDGSVNTGEINGTMIDYQGRNIVQVTVKDVTERRKAERETKEAKEFMENIFRTSVDGIMVTDNEGSITLVNEAITKMLGYSKNELIGKRTGVFNPKGESYKKNVGKYLTLLFEEGTVTAFELTYLKKDRNLIDVEVNSALLRDNKGNIAGTVSTIRDITERKQDEAQLKETKDHLDNIIESSLDGIIVSDSVGNVIRVNKSFLALVGFEEEEVIGKHIMELSITNMRTYESTTGEMVEINEAFLNTSMEMSVKLYEEGKVSNWESYYLRKDGIIVPVEMKLSHLYDEIGDNIGAVGVIRDITERRKAEKEIIEARDFLENIFKTTADGIIVTDNEGSITMVNDAMEEITGYPRAELLKQHVTLLTPTDKQHYSEGEHEIEKLVKEGVLKERESLLKRKDGQCIIIETNMSLLFDKKGQTIGCVGINSDITERKKMEQQLLQSEKLKSLGELSGGVAHDFNNVLAAILGRVQLLKMQIKAPLGTQEKRESALELKKGLEIIEKASLDGAETVRRIQEFSRRRTDDKDFTQVDLNELIDNALEFTRVRWKNDAESKGIKIRIRKELSPLNFTLGSSSELREVFTNLINNAIDAMPQGGEIRINSLMNNNNVVVKIGDTGGGIPKDIKDRVFDPFFTTKGVQSTGLGLSVSYGIINRHRGTITVNSVEGEGTTFTIKFPITKKTGEWKVKEEKVVPIKRKQQKASILLIEDEEGVRHLLRDILTGAGHNVEVAADGNEGIEIFKKKKFDLVFTDLGMPVMSGWEVAEKVKRINDKVPVALITGWNVALDSSKMNDSGMDLVIHKPFKMEQVLNLVQEGMILRDQLKAV